MWTVYCLQKLQVTTEQYARLISWNESCSIYSFKAYICIPFELRVHGNVCCTMAFTICVVARDTSLCPDSYTQGAEVATSNTQTLAC